MDDYWNHNAAYHDAIAAAARRRRGRVLDVGCGEALLVQRLARVARRVTGVDRDPAAIARAHERTAALANVTLRLDDFLEMPAEPASYDLITFVARLHARSDAPILVVADTRDEECVVAALDAGAADVVPLPVRQLELVARVNAALRRRPPSTTGIEANLDGLTVDGGRHEATVAGRRLALTPTEFELLAVIAARRGEIVDHWKLLRAGWADHRDVDLETLRTHLNHLNQKLVAEGHPGLRNVRGRGYGLRIAAGDMGDRG